MFLVIQNWMYFLKWDTEWSDSKSVWWWRTWTMASSRLRLVFWMRNANVIVEDRDLPQNWVFILDFFNWFDLIISIILTYHLEYLKGTKDAKFNSNSFSGRNFCLLLSVANKLWLMKVNILATFRSESDNCCIFDPHFDQKKLTKMSH